jgi:hypothetical protein
MNSIMRKGEITPVCGKTSELPHYRQLSLEKTDLCLPCFCPFKRDVFSFVLDSFPPPCPVLSAHPRKNAAIPHPRVPGTGSQQKAKRHKYAR